MTSDSDIDWNVTCDIGLDSYVDQNMVVSLSDSLPNDVDPRKNLNDT